MITEKKKRIMTAFMLTAVLGMAQGSFAQETEALAPETEQAAAEVRLHPVVQTNSLADSEYIQDGDYSDYVLYAQVRYPVVYLQEEEAAAFPQLSQALNDYYGGLKAEKEECLQSISANAHERFESLRETGQTDLWGGYTNELTAEVVRADECVLSIRNSSSSYEGGAHGYYDRTGVTFDTKSGQILQFTDVITDTAAAAQHTFEKLALLYPDVELNLEQDDVAEMFAANDEGFGWTLEPDGVMVYFPPYVLSSYAAGLQAVLLSYVEYPELFEPAYAHSPEKWIVPLDSSYGIQADFGDGVHMLSLTGTMQEYGDYSDRIILMDETRYSFSDDTTHYFSTRGYLVASEGKLWLWCFDQQENDYTQLRVYGFENGEPFDTGYAQTFSTGLLDAKYEGDYSSEDEIAMTDPDHVILSKRMQAMGTYGAYKVYSVSGSGTPISDDPYYTPLVSGRSLTLKQPLTLQMVGQDGTGEEMKEWPEGTTCVILRTDGANWTDLVMDGDETQVARVMSDYSSWPHMVGNIAEEDLFDGVMYAG